MNTISINQRIKPSVKA